MKSIALLGVICASFACADPAFTQDSGVTKNLFASSGVCKECHADIHSFWKNSMHAFSYSDPIFKTAYEKAMKISQEAKALCLQCHAPATQLNRDYEMQYEVTREGVTCDFCHVVIAVTRASENFAYKFNLDRTRVGPLRNADSPIHASAYSELHTKSEICAGCHEYTNPAGVRLLETYSEWKQSPYAAEGVQCQGCHMPIGEGYVVRPGVRQSPKGINLHNLQGGHSIDKVKMAAKVRISDIQKFHEGARITVEVTNTGSGHRIPTGTPSRELLLEISLLSVSANQLIQKKELVFDKTLTDKHGRILDGDAEIMLSAGRILSDTRIWPRETRTSQFTFVGLPSNLYRIRAKLYYNYIAETSPGQVQQMLVEMVSDEKPISIE
ncbi:hypothetical protein HZA56_12260 [Candidatus Poribacteria bacterium]|nr:hypothetical protein [Candidatus Poribacteria bacterium]